LCTFDYSKFYHMKKIVSLLLIIVCIQWSCTKEDTQVCADKQELKLNIPQSNVTAATIGRVLFYDTRLSANNTIACASCHKQAHGFADNSALSTGFQGKQTVRNSIAITSSNFMLMNPLDSTFISSGQFLFWDGREQLLHNMVLLPILNHVEMGISNREQIVERVKSAGYYRELFASMNNTSVDNIDINDISNCLAAFVSSIQNRTSKFDLVNQGLQQFDALETEGKDLFINVYPCGSCHTVQGGGGYNGTAPGIADFVDIGLDNSPSDLGRGAVTHVSADNGKFKVPILKNVANTAPYMHDGRFNTLEEVLDHYSHGIRNDQNLDPRLKNADGSAMVLNITDHQKRALIAFLNTLTDFSSMSDEELSDPFKR
jgi:cytochrome c peroxidase